MIDQTINFDTIEKLIKQYKELNGNLKNLKTQLNNVMLELKELRKDVTIKYLNQEILSKNSLYSFIKPLSFFQV